MSVPGSPVHLASITLLVYDPMTRALHWIIHLCRSLWLGNNPVKCSQVAQVLLCSLVMNQPAVTGISTVSRVTIQVWWRAAGNGAWRVQHSFAGTKKKILKNANVSEKVVYSQTNWTWTDTESYASAGKNNNLRDLILRPHPGCVWQSFSMPPPAFFIGRQTSENERLLS